MTERQCARPWLKISSGAGPTVLAMDFDVTGRPEATFRDLAVILPGQPAIWQAVPPPSRVVAGRSACGYLDWWQVPPDPGQGEVAAIVGYCGGSFFAQALAERVTARQAAAPVVVLFNPGVPTVATLHRNLTGAIAGMTALTAGERADLRGQARLICLDAPDDLAMAGRGLEELYRAATEVTFDRLDLDADLADELTGLFTDYVAYLVAARALAAEVTLAGAVAITSSERDSADGFNGQRIVVDVDRKGLLRSPATAKALHGLIAPGKRIR